MDGPQFNTNTAWMVTLKLDILQNLGQTDNFSSTNITSRNFLQISVIFAVSSHCYTKGLHKEDRVHRNPKCCFYIPATLHPFFGDKSVFLIYLHTYYETITNPHITTYYNTIQQCWVHSLSTTPNINSVTVA